MSDLIDRQEAIDILDQYAATLNPDRDNTELGRVDRIRRFIEQLSSAQSERKRGKWINAYDRGVAFKRCSECGIYVEDTFFANDYEVNFCPNCGKYMVARCFK